MLVQQLDYRLNILCYQRFVQFSFSRLRRVTFAREHTRSTNIVLQDGGLAAVGVVF